MAIITCYFIFFNATADYIRKSSENLSITNFTSLTSLTNSSFNWADSDNGTYHGLPDNFDEKIRLLFFGDLMLDRHVGEKIAARGPDHLFAALATSSAIDFFAYDLVSANLEGAVTDGGAHYPPLNAYDFAFAPELIAGLKNYNFSFFNLANNHLADQGERGIIETEKNLNELGFYFSGCADGRTGECGSTKLRMRNLELGMAGFSLVYRLPAEEEMIGIVAELASTTDLVVVNTHWGAEYEHGFNLTQQRLARALIEAGADIIIGHHPHVVQGMEIYEGKPIFYSLGNFIFDQYFSAATQEGLAVGITLDGENMAIELLPFRSKSSQPSLMPEKEKDEFLTKFIGWSDLDDELSERIKNGFLPL